MTISKLLPKKDDSHQRGGKYSHIPLAFGLFWALTSCHTFSKPDKTWVSKPVQLSAYKREHYEALSKFPRTPASLGGLLNQAKNKGILLIGDIHDNKDLHRRILGFLREWSQIPGKKALFVEFLGLEDEETLRRFDQGGLQAEDLAKEINLRWPHSWLQLREFDPPFYQSILYLCQEEKIDLQAMEPIPRLPLNQRDRRMARALRKYHRENPRALIAVLVGHTHLLGRGHLAQILGSLPGFPEEKELPLLLPDPATKTSPHPNSIQKAGASYYLWRLR